MGSLACPTVMGHRFRVYTLKRRMGAVVFMGQRGLLFSLFCCLWSNPEGKPGSCVS